MEKFFIIVLIIISLAYNTLSNQLFNQEKSILPPLRYPPIIGTGDINFQSEPRYKKIMEGETRSRENYHQQQQQQQQQQQKTRIDLKLEIDKLNNSYAQQESWPDLSSRQLGVVSAVSFDVNGNVVVFHRSSRKWNQETFDTKNIYQKQFLGPIRDNTLITFNRQTGDIEFEWGKNLFYMPHGLTIDHENNVWITDVALHQIMKFRANNTKPDLEKGIAFVPGRTREKFCKPTSVAVLPNGDFFVADGYCNSRILKFSKSGEFLLEWGKNSFQGTAHTIALENYFAVPHSLTLALDLGLLCVADRENGRIQCFQIENGTFHSQYHDQIMGDRLFSVAYAPIRGGQLFIVNGPTISDSEEHLYQVRGYVLDMKTKNILGKFGEFSNPHDVIVSSDGGEIYVAELDPSRVHKFVLADTIQKTDSIINVKPTATLDDPSLPQQKILSAVKSEPSPTALIVASLIALFTLLTCGMAVLISRRRKRGCFPLLGTRNRRHAWDFPTVKTPDGFKLGKLLDRKKGFEKLNQDASDEEPSAATNMLSSAQFA